MLLSRYPNATPAELREARAYACGGCVIRDLSYYSLGNHYFSHLTHYVPQRRFVEALLGDSQNVDENAFALGGVYLTTSSCARSTAIS